VESSLDVNPSTVEEGVTSCAITPDPARSLFVTDKTALAAFSLQAVMKQIVTSGSTTGQTALGLYKQMLDTLNDSAHAVTKGPHCDDHKNASGVPTINGFPEQFCPRQEGFLATTNPFVAQVDGGANQDAYVPVGLVNRFDLAPKSGANCGQHRVVFGKVSGQTSPFDRMLLIFEAVLPNPQATPADPNPGLAGCLPVAKFWDDLSADASATSRAAKLKSFYFTGLPGFQPVIKASHYGFGGGTNTGQIRSNMFMFQAPGDPISAQEWELREFRLSQSCTGTACTLTANNTFVQTNPFGTLFGGADTQSKNFQAAFINQVPHLAARTIPNIGMTTGTQFDGPQSDEQAPSNNDYFTQAQSNTAFLNNITNKLAAIGRTDLTAHNIIDRATTQSCAGCHELAVGRPLGAGLTWPSSLGFVQVNEFANLSPALTDSFLPARAKVLVNFINASCADSGAALADDGTTLGGSEVGAAN
jgi:hypothetical protein